MAATKKTTTKQSSSSDLLEKYLAAAKKVKEADIIVCRADPRIAFANVKTGVENLFGPEGAEGRKERIEDVQAQLPRLDVKKALKLVDLSRAVMLAAQKVALPVSNGEIEEKLAIVGKHRDPVLKTAEVLAKKGLLPAEAVAKIRAGSGKYDMASDGVALADLFRAHEANIKGKHAFTDEELGEMRDAGEWLLDRLTPTGAKRPAPVKSEAADLRDRLWTLLVSSHADLRVMGYVVFRDDFDKKVPKLQSMAAAVAPREPVDGAPAGGEDARAGGG